MGNSLSDIPGVELGFLIGAVPTIAMMLSETYFVKYAVSPQTEACFQNFAAGLIIAAVAQELFPLVNESTPTNAMIGVSGGFVVALSMIYGLEYLVSYIEENADKQVEKSSIKSRTYPIGLNPDESSLEGFEMKDLAQISVEDWEEEPIVRASLALASQNHRNHIKEHLKELLDQVKAMEEKSDSLLEKRLSVKQTEQIAEEIDSEIHNLQYKLDHCRRLLQGSEAETFEGDNPLLTSAWITEDRKIDMKKRLLHLKNTSQHLIDHINEPVIDKNVLQEMHEHMDQMDKLILHFHESVEGVGSKWHRRDLVETQMGDTLPLGLVIPVTMDCFTDGFLIGVTCGVQPAAGIILGIANCLEMSFLGMAYSARLSKCTGSSAKVRFCAVYIPPLIMFLASGLGAAIASATVGIPALYIGFVSFGLVALLFLVCNELLIEARAAQGEDERWWISIMVFIGIYLVLMLSHWIP
eukprot:gene7894-10713_t